jgi:hypothetical protein
MQPLTKDKSFVARTVYHHGVRTGEFVTLLAYRDNRNGTYELWDNREAENDYISGTEDFVRDEWVARNRQLVEDGFRRDDLRGENKWQQFIS